MQIVKKLDIHPSLLSRLRFALPTSCEGAADFYSYVRAIKYISNIAMLLC